MPRKASGKLQVKQVPRPQKNGDTYIYEVTTRYNPEKRYNEHVSSHNHLVNYRYVVPIHAIFSHVSKSRKPA